MAHNNTQKMESYYNTSVNHSINVKQSNDVHFVCDSNNRNKLKIINTGLYMMTIFDECKSTQNSHIQLNINIPFTNCIYNIGLFIVTLWLQSNDTIRKRKMKSWSLWFQRNFKVIMPFYAYLDQRRGIFGEICVGGVFVFLYCYAWHDPLTGRTNFISVMSRLELQLYNSLSSWHVISGDE